jgi:hypothetical protein
VNSHKGTKGKWSSNVQRPRDLVNLVDAAKVVGRDKSTLSRHATARNFRTWRRKDAKKDIFVSLREVRAFFDSITFKMVPKAKRYRSIGG